MSLWDIASNAFCLLAAFALIFVGLCSAKQGLQGITLALLSFALLFTILPIATRFKHIKGFGFELDAWEQKEHEAVKLIDKLSNVSAVIAEQTISLTLGQGSWDSAPDNIELAKQLEQFDYIFMTTSLDEAKKNSITAPLIDRIKSEYFQATIRTIEMSLNKALQNLKTPSSSASLDIQNEIKNKITDLENLQKRTVSIFNSAFEANNLLPLIQEITRSAEFEGKSLLLHELSELNEDIQFFIKNRKLRRNVRVNHNSN
jgi:hypothetical protein